MPFDIVRNDIVNMQVDAIVNTANPRPRIGYGVDAGVHKKAGPELLKAREIIGDIDIGQVAITPGFGLPANYVIHAVGPVWRDGAHNEEKLLRQCYDRALQMAVEYGCETIAFPLLSAGNHGFPKKIALRIAVNAFSDFLMDHEMQIYLVVFSKETVELSSKLLHDVGSYIDENYILAKKLDEYGVEDKRAVREEELAKIREDLQRRLRARHERVYEEAYSNSVDYCIEPAVAASASKMSAKCAQSELQRLLEETDAGFSETLLKLLDRTGKKDSEIYKKANVDRKLFSKIRNNPDYKPSKATALAFAVALELSLEETQDFIKRAGFAFSHSNKFDIIVEFFIKNGNYDVFELNEVLFKFDQVTIGGGA